MNRIVSVALGMGILVSSCVSQKKFSDMEAYAKQKNDLLNTATVKLNECLVAKEDLIKENTFLRANTNELISTVDNITTLTTKGAQNLERSLESLREKDVVINNLRDAVNRRDSVNLALVQSLKGVLGAMDDGDIEINVDKGAVFVSISDKLLFNSGSYLVGERAKEVLGKVAKVVNNKPDFEFMVEGHTDDVPYTKGVLLDNWDLSVKRATAVVRILQNEFGVNPARMTAAGRSEYVPVSTSDNSKNRRTRIMVLPKIDQFYNMINDEMSK